MYIKFEIICLYIIPYLPLYYTILNTEHISSITNVALWIIFIHVYAIGDQCDCNFPHVLIIRKLSPESNTKDTSETGLPRFGSCPVTMTGLSTVMVAPIAVPSS